MKKYFIWTAMLLFLTGCSLFTTTARVEPTTTTTTEVASTSTVTLAPSPIPQSTAKRNCEKIAFVMFDNPQRQNADIYTICPDGNDLVRLTHDSATDESPAWSLDGTKIAFVSSRSGTSQIYLMNADGSAPMQITFDYENSLPKWLPDGKHIAFLTTDAKGLWWWRVARIDGNEVKQLTEPSYDFFYQTPSWAPDGIRIAYMSLEEAKARNDGSSQIHVKNADGTDDHALTNDIWANINPVWSPDGMKLAFLSERDGTYNAFALYIMNSDGSDVHKLTEPIFEDVSTSYSWSSDGKQIVIGDAHTGCIFIINLAMNSKAEALINEGGIAFAPSWQP